MHFALGFVAKENPTIENIIDHRDHIVGFVNSGHVGLDSDFYGIS